MPESVLPHAAAGGRAGTGSGSAVPDALLLPWKGVAGLRHGPRVFCALVRRRSGGYPELFCLRAGGGSLPALRKAADRLQQLFPDGGMQHHRLSALAGPGAAGLRAERGCGDHQHVNGPGARRGADQCHAGNYGRGYDFRAQPYRGRYPDWHGHCTGVRGGAGDRADVLRRDLYERCFLYVYDTLSVRVSGLPGVYADFQYPRHWEADLLCRRGAGLAGVSAVGEYDFRRLPCSGGHRHLRGNHVPGPPLPGVRLRTGGPPALGAWRRYLLRYGALRRWRDPAVFKHPPAHPRYGRCFGRRRDALILRVPRPLSPYSPAEKEVKSFEEWVLLRCSCFCK